MKELIAEQTTRLKMAKIRADAEAKILLQMLPDHVQATLHYNGKERAIESHSEYREAIEAISA